MSFFEQYRLNIPLLVPSRRLMASWAVSSGLLEQRSWASVFGMVLSPSLARSPIHAHTRARARTHTHTHTHTHTDIHVHTLTHTYIHTHTHTHSVQWARRWRQMQSIATSQTPTTISMRILFFFGCRRVWHLCVCDMCVCVLQTWLAPYWCKLAPCCCKTTGGLKLCWLKQSTSLLSMSAYLRVCVVYVCLCVHVCILSCESHICVCHMCVRCVRDTCVFL